MLSLKNFRADTNSIRARNLTVRTSPVLRNSQSYSRCQHNFNDVRQAYEEDNDLLLLMDHLVNSTRKYLKDLPSFYRSSLDPYTTRNGLVYYTVVAGDTPRVIVPTHNSLRLRIMYECHNIPTCGYGGKEKTYRTVSRDF